MFIFISFPNSPNDNDDDGEDENEDGDAAEIVIPCAYVAVRDFCAGFPMGDVVVVVGLPVLRFHPDNDGDD